MSESLLLGFIIDLENTKVHSDIKLALVELIERNLLVSDRGYYYCEHEHVPNRISEIVASILTDRCPEPLNLGGAMEKTIYVLGNENLEDYKRYVFIISDRYKFYNSPLCQRAIRLDQRDGINSVFIFCDFANSPHKFEISGPNVMWWQISIAEFKNRIIEFVKTLNN